jgi:hypothetical protein
MNEDLFDKFKKFSECLEKNNSMKEDLEED